jgi:hypothetical protein
MRGFLAAAVWQLCSAAKQRGNEDGIVRTPAPRQWPAAVRDDADVMTGAAAERRGAAAVAVDAAIEAAALCPLTPQDASHEAALPTGGLVARLRAAAAAASSQQVWLSIRREPAAECCSNSADGRQQLVLRLTAAGSVLSQHSAGDLAAAGGGHCESCRRRAVSSSCFAAYVTAAGAQRGSVWPSGTTA